MKDYEFLSKRDIPEKTVDIRRLIGKRVLSKGGSIIGRISEVRVNSKNFELEGVVISGGYYKPLFVAKNYFSKLSDEAVILNEELCMLLRGKRVISSDGRVIGKVSIVNRKGMTNELESLVVKSLWRTYLIPKSEIEQIGSTIKVKRKHDATKTYLWKRLKQNTNI